MKTKYFWNIVGLAMVFTFTVVVGGCSNGSTEKPTAQSKNITIAAGKTVTVNFTALPGTTPSWWSTLEDVFEDRAAGFAPGHYTLNVQYSGTDGFVAGGVGSGIATVSEAFLAASDFAAMRASMGPMVSSWTIAMIRNSNVYIAIGGRQGNQRG